MDNLIEEIRNYSIEEIMVLYSTVMQELLERGIDIGKMGDSKLDVTEYSHLVSKLREM